MQQAPKYKVVLFLIVLLIIMLTITYLYLYVQRLESQRQKRLEQRYHLLCEVLQPGMSKNEVLEKLKEIGEIAVAGEKEEPSTPLHIVFTSPEKKEIYGGFDLDFAGDKYIRASVLGFDSLEIICDFRH